MKENCKTTDLLLELMIFNLNCVISCLEYNQEYLCFLNCLIDKILSTFYILKILLNNRFNYLTLSGKTKMWNLNFCIRKAVYFTLIRRI